MATRRLTAEERANRRNQDAELEKLFDYERSTSWPKLPKMDGITFRVGGNRLQKTLFLFYSPLGILFCVLRCFLGLHAFIVSCLLPKESRFRCLVLRVLSAVLGIWVVEKGERKGGKVIVANHISPLDHSAIQLVQPCVLPSVWDLPSFLMWCFGYADLGVRDGRNTLIARAKDFCKSSHLPLLAFPEGAMTNGRVGLLKFNSWPFSLTHPVELCKMEISRPNFLSIAPTVIGSRWWTDLLWLFFTPYTLFDIEWLGLISQSDDESFEEFAARGQERLCQACGGLSRTRFTSSEVVDFAKRRLLEEEQKRRAQMEAARQRSRSPRKTGSELDTMALRVKEMLPQVPLHVIRKDLDGTVPYNPETGDTPKKVVQRLPQSVSADPSSWKSIYEERKWAMIEENRRKFMARNKMKTSDLFSQDLGEPSGS